MGDRLMDQKLAFVRLGIEVAKELEDVGLKVAAYVKEYYQSGLADGGYNDLVDADFAGTDLEGYTEQDYEDLIGSLDALETGYMATHRINLMKAIKR